jgi:hypothetical protein
MGVKFKTYLYQQPKHYLAQFWCLHECNSQTEAFTKHKTAADRDSYNWKMIKTDRPEKFI